MQKTKNTQLCGVFGGVSFVVYAGYLLLSNVLLFVRTEGFFNPMSLLAVAELAVIGIAALTNRQGLLLKVTAWLLAVQNLLSVGSVLLSLLTTVPGQPVFWVVLTSGMSSLASVLLAVVLLVGLHARRGTNLRVLCVLPVLVQLAAIALQLPLLEGITTGTVALTPSNLLWLALRCLGMLLVGLWVTAPRPVAQDGVSVVEEEPFPFEAER